MASYLDAWVPELKADLKLANWNAIIDQVLRESGVPEEDVPTGSTQESDDELTRLLLLWWAYERGLNALQLRVAFSVGNPSTSIQANQAYEMVKKMQDAVDARLVAFGRSMNGITSGNVLTNWLAVEPVI